MKSLLAHLRTGLAAGLTIVLAACGGGGGGSEGGGGGIGGTGTTDPGTLRFSLTDAPACGYDAVHVTIDRVRVHMDASAAEGDGGWHDIVVSPARRIDLLTLQNGVLAELGQVSLPSGRYIQMRLVLAANGSTPPYANAVVPTGGPEVALTTPSGQQSGVKATMAIDVPPGQVADAVIDFDACRSVVRRGNSGHYNLKPVLTVIPVFADAGLRVTGQVDPALGTTASLSLQVDGVPVKATQADAAGRYTLYPVPAGTYDLVVSAPGRATAVVTGVPVVGGTPTAIGTVATPLVPPVSGSRAVSGTASPADTTVSAVQALTGGPRATVAWPPVDADTGAFALTLPTAAPVRATYGPSFVFTADTPVANRYTLEAVSAAGTRKTQVIDTAAPVPPVAFSFP